MLDRLKTMENRYEELGHMLMDPDIGSDIKKMTEVTKEQASLQAAYDLYQEYKEIEAGSCTTNLHNYIFIIIWIFWD